VRDGPTRSLVEAAGRRPARAAARASDGARQAAGSRRRTAAGRADCPRTLRASGRGGPARGATGSMPERGPLKRTAARSAPPRARRRPLAGPWIERRPADDPRTGSGGTPSASTAGSSTSFGAGHSDATSAVGSRCGWRQRAGPRADRQRRRGTAGSHYRRRASDDVGDVQARTRSAAPRLRHPTGTPHASATANASAVTISPSAGSPRPTNPSVRARRRPVRAPDRTP
jgi:hypothetical protein